MKTMKIGNVMLKNPLVLAPMADITSVSFRLLCKEYGAALVVTEMVNANAVARNNKSTLNLARVTDEERPVAIQLFGQKTSNIVKAAQMLEKDADIIDFNCGCPVQRVMDQGAGAALLKRPSKLKSIIEEASSTISKPLTVKIRSGLTKKSIHAVETAQLVEKAGASAITIHARTQDQGYSGKADWNVIKDIKKAVSIPIIGNGDVFDALSCKRMMEETGCDGVMIGRAVRGNPYLFRQCEHYLENGEMLPEQTVTERIDDFMRLVSYAERFKDIDVVRLKRRAMDFTKGIEGSANLRFELSKCRTSEDVITRLNEIKGKVLG